MRNAKLGALSIVIGTVLGATVVACEPPSPTGASLRPAKGRSASDVGENEDDLDLDDDEDEVTAGTPPSTTPPTTTPAAKDSDNDGVPDTEDCEPTSAAIAGRKLLRDTLATDSGFFTVADGFPTTSWAYDGTAYRQVRIGDFSDTTVFNRDPAIGDVIIEVRSASTEITNTINPSLRQMFILLGTAVTGGSLSAIGCGVEVVSGEAVTQKTSIVRLSGPPSAVATTPVQRVNRAAVQVNEQFTIKATLRAGTLTCQVTQGVATTTTASANVGALKGSVGLFTRQTKALFKDASICKLN